MYVWTCMYVCRHHAYNTFQVTDIKRPLSRKVLIRTYVFVFSILCLVTE